MTKNLYFSPKKLKST
jgi:hypothetical protein